MADSVVSKSRFRMLLLAGAAIVGGSAAAGADTSGLATLYVPAQTTGIGANLYSGGSSVPGSTAVGAECAPTIQQAHAAAYSQGVQRRITISQSERPAPGKIITTCLTTLETQLAALDVFSNAGPWAIENVLTGIENFAEGMICDVFQAQFNQVVSATFNQVAFMSDTIPCGANISYPGLGGSSGGLNYCSAIGGALGGSGSSLYTLSISATAPTANSTGANYGLSTLLGQ